MNLCQNFTDFLKAAQMHIHSRKGLNAKHRGGGVGIGGALLALGGITEVPPSMFGNRYQACSVSTNT